MTAGIFIEGRRPKSKKAIREAIANGHILRTVVENTSMFGGFSGSIADLAVGQSITFVGPCPYTARNFYGTITRTQKGYTVK